MKATFPQPFFEHAAEGKLCIANVIHFTGRRLLAFHVWPWTADPRTHMAQDGGVELSETLGADS